MRRDEYRGQIEVPFADIADVFDDGRRRTIRADNPRWFEPRIEPPRDELQALMETPPGHEPAALLPESDLLDLIDNLDPDDRDLVNALVFERLSLRDAGKRFGVGKSTVQRRRDRVFEVLRGLLLEAIEGEEE